MRLFHISVLAVALLPGCATVLDGTTQAVTIRTAPVGASCSVRQGQDVVREIRSTPETFLVKRNQKDLLVTCEKPGWDVSATLLRAKFTGVTVGNLFIGAFGGLVLDGASGADFRYDDDRIIQLTPRGSGRLTDRAGSRLAGITVQPGYQPTL